MSSAYHTPLIEAVEQRPRDVVFFRPSSRVEGEHPREEEIRDGESPYSGLLTEQPLWNNVGGWEANKDLPIYDESRDLMKVVEEEEHKLHKEEVRHRFVKGVGYLKARRSKPYPPQGRMSCCGGGRKAEDSSAIKGEEVDHFRDLAPNRELHRNIRRARESIGDQTLVGDIGFGTGCIEGFSEAENCKENVIESINTINLFYILKKCNQVQTFLVMPFIILGKV